jgi:hypothetical protein
MPAQYALGYEEGDDPALVVHPSLVPLRLSRGHPPLRSITQRCQLRLLDRLSHVRFCAWRLDVGPKIGLGEGERARWGDPSGCRGDRLSELYEVSGWPPDMRVICRRERAHPGAQLSLLDTHAGWHHTCFITDTFGADIAALELRHRGPRPRRGPGAQLEGVRPFQPAPSRASASGDE